MNSKKGLFSVKGTVSRDKSKFCSTGSPGKDARSLNYLLNLRQVFFAVACLDVQPDRRIGLAAWFIIRLHLKRKVSQDFSTLKKTSPGSPMNRQKWLREFSIFVMKYLPVHLGPRKRLLSKKWRSKSGLLSCFEICFVLLCANMARQ